VPAQVRRTYRGEEEWFPLLEEAGPSRLRKAFIATGVTPAVAGQLVWFLEEQLHLERHLSHRSRVSYRQVLRDLDLDKVTRAIPRQFNPERQAA
jgi:hypothetical protein